MKILATRSATAFVAVTQVLAVPVLLTVRRASLAAAAGDG